MKLEIISYRRKLESMPWYGKSIKNVFSGRLKNDSGVSGRGRMTWGGGGRRTVKDGKNFSKADEAGLSPSREPWSESLI